MIEKQGLQRCRRRPVDFEIGIVPGVRVCPIRGDKRRVWVRLVRGEKIYAADDRDGSVGDENLSMIAVVERKHTRERIDRMKFEKFDSCGLEAIEKLAWRIHGAIAVVDHANCDSLLSLRDQQIGEILTVALDILEYIIFEVDALDRSVDRLEHRSKRFGAVMQ